MKSEKYLVLNKYILDLFGVDEFEKLQKKFKDEKEGIDSNGRSYYLNTLLGSGNLKISEDDLNKYDENIQEYVRKINEKRGNIKLKYFQYLAVLFTEIFLDNITNRKTEFIYKLNEFLEEYKQKEKIEIEPFIEEDFKKLAYWMATGSGKTLIMHINYLQFLKYKPFEPDNILLITPNLSLSYQHFQELEKSGIPAKLYSENKTTGSEGDYEILIIEITKLAEEKKGSGLSLTIDTFEGKNLIFVDEGHKGQKSEEKSWIKKRKELTKNGFAFEYSATFGQILDSDKEILKDYAKAIIFDYSYKYFYNDGYGKDFQVLNVKKNEMKDEEFQEAVLVANLLDFYQQMFLYKTKPDLVREYNIEKPLWVFVGTTVAGKNVQSDILQIIKFLSKAFDERWLKSKIEKILTGGYKKENGEDIFKDKFDLIRNNLDLGDLYKSVFHGKGAFKIYEIKDADGELGLRVGDNNYFGVVNVGNLSELKKLLAKEGFIVEQDAISSSLFDNIKKPDSTINILIGAKKFIEGWDTWRVSSMGLLHIGSGEGPQIIQLFGRGVRLKGKDMSLKRSNKQEIKHLETLNIYGIKADYIDKFLSVIAKEDVDYDPEEIKIPVKTLEPEIWQNLPYLSKNESKIFEEDIPLKLTKDNKIYYKLDLVPKITIYDGTKKDQSTLQVEEKTIYDIIDSIELLNWNKIFVDIINYKNLKGYWNLYFDIEDLKDILHNCKIREKPEFFNIQNIKKLEDITILLIKGYIDKFYKNRKGKYETENMHYKKAGEQLKLFLNQKVEYYTVKVSKKEHNLIKEIKSLAENMDKLLKDDLDVLPRITIENSVFIPILLESEKIKISPPGLNESEKKFVEGLEKYLKGNQKSLSQYDIVLLRNESRSGLGFQLDWSEFYPDFIMWIKDKNADKTHLVFIDPKGLHHTQKLKDEKVQFKEYLKEIEKNLNNGVSLNSFILSITKYEDLIKGEVPPTPKEEFEKANILFLNDDWTEKLFKKILGVR
ncbi:MAG: DEAD/DEAH box helicase family protein [Sulfurihydrogenibium sp.]|nr:DEAD/DEAH box helicase family protein [Sulfurihydrogenibium sp.]